MQIPVKGGSAAPERQKCVPSLGPLVYNEQIKGR